MSQTNETLTEFQKAIIQFMMRLRMVDSYTLTENVFKKLYIAEYDPPDPDTLNYVELLDSQITQINNSLHELGFVIKRYRKESDLLYVFINTASDEVSKLMTTHSAKSIQAINAVIDLIVKNDSVHETEVCNIIVQATDGSYTKSDSLKLLDTLVKDKWLELQANKNYSLSGRLLTELGDTLRTQQEVPLVDNNI